MEVTSLDHIVLVVADVARSAAFYHEILGMEPREERPGKWSLHFGNQKISLQDAANVPAVASGTSRGCGNFCVLTESPVEALAETLVEHGIELVAGPGERQGAVGVLKSVYFRDPDGNLVEVSNQL